MGPVLEWLRGLLRRRDDAGFTLIETVVAMGVATTMFTALAYTATSAVTTSQVARQNQQAADLANARVEQVRQMPWGSLGHNPDSFDCSDPDLVACPGNPAYAGRPLVTIAGGIGFASSGSGGTQIETVTSNNVTYDVKTYVTSPADTTGAYRLVTVIVTWKDYGRERSKSASTVVSQSTRGLPLPDFTLTPVGPPTVTVNPGATAVWGFELTNQGAPDTWNITAGGAYAMEFYVDDGNDVFSPTADTVKLTDHNSDMKPDTGRLDPNQSYTFWGVYQVPTTAANGTTSASVIATSVSQETATSASKSVATSLVVTTAIVSASPTPTPSSTATPTPSGSSSPTPSESTSPTPTPSGSLGNATCPDPSPAATPAAVTGYTRKAYTLHNSGNTAWPTFPLPGSDPIPGSAAMKPMAMNLTADSIPTGRALPVLSTDLVPADTGGRLLYTGGSFSGATNQVADWQNSLQSKAYTGTIVLRTWADEAPGASGTVQLSAQLYQYRSSGDKTETIGSVVTQTVGSCDGFRGVSFSFPASFTLTKNYVLGVRVWNSGSIAARLAYDHADYPATLTVVEQ